MNAWLALTGSLIFLVVGASGFLRAVRAELSGASRLLMWGTAMPLGIAGTLLASYRVDGRTLVYGFPLPVAFLRLRENGAWADFVGPLTTPFMFINAAVNVGVVLYVLTTLLRGRTHGQAERGGTMGENDSRAAEPGDEADEAR